MRASGFHALGGLEPSKIGFGWADGIRLGLNSQHITRRGLYSNNSNNFSLAFSVFFVSWHQISAAFTLSGMKNPHKISAYIISYLNLSMNYIVAPLEDLNDLYNWPNVFL